MRAVATIIASTMLSGCWWVGPVFYKPDPAASAPLSAGMWEGTDADGKVSSHRIVRYPDGAFGPGPGEAQDKSRLVFRPLPVKGRDLWITEMTSDDPAKDEATYGLAEREGEEVDLLPLLDCEGNEALVQKAGGKVEKAETEKAISDLPDANAKGQTEIDPKSIGTTCTFADAASLERALTAFAALHPRLDGGARLKRKGD